MARSDIQRRPSLSLATAATNGCFVVQCRKVSSGSTNGNCPPLRRVGQVDVSSSGLAPPVDLTTRPLDLMDENLLLRERGAVFRSKDLVAQPFKSVLRDGVILLRAQDQPDRWILLRHGPVFARVVEIEMHLSGIGVRELAEFQVDDDQAAQLSVKEEQVELSRRS